MAESFEDRISKIMRSTEPSEGYEQVKNVLQRMCDSIAKELRAIAGTQVYVILEPGWLANAGQQLRVVVGIPSVNYQDTLFKVYIPPPLGFPVQLDFYGDEPTVAPDAATLEREIVSFLARPEVKLRLQAYSEMARKRLA
jgi:hypothetical protein